MKYMLDTNICIYIIKHNPPKVVTQFESLHVGDICLSSITLAELQYGVAKSAHQQKNAEALKQFVLSLDILPFDENACLFYGEILSFLEKKGISIGALDLLIAAHALKENRTLVTNNTNEFSRIPNLKIENWV